MISGSFLLFATDHGPALQLRDRLALFDPHHVARLEFVLFVVRVVVLGAADRLLVDRMGEAASYFFVARTCAATVLIRAISRRASFIREVFSSCPVARWKRRLKRSFFRLRIASSIWSGLIARISAVFISAMITSSL